MVETIIASGAFIGVVAFIIGMLVDHFLAESKWKKLYRLTIQIVAEQVEASDWDVPDFLALLIDRLHESTENTKELEHLIEEEKIKN